MTDGQTTDAGTGGMLGFAVLALGGAAVTAFAPTQAQTAWGFGATITLGSLAIAAIHLSE